jgi:hypothetical protein
MPYIKQTDRERYEAGLSALFDAFREVERWETSSAFPGHLNYVITTLIKTVYDNMVVANDSKMGYSEYNEIIGMLECCKMELYSRVVRPYEEKKKLENGDVF